MGWTSAETVLDRFERRDDPTPSRVFDRRTLDHEVLLENRAIRGQKTSARRYGRKRRK